MAAFLVTMGACKKSFLDVQPITTVTDENFYKTPADGFKALVGCYDGLQLIWSAGVSLPVAADVFSDDCFGGTGNADGYGYQMLDEFDKSRSPADQDVFGQNWAFYYKALYRCNVLLAKMDQINWAANTTLRNTYEAETRYIRAYLYFDMIRLWGHIPLLTAPSAENMPQANPDDIYKVIAGDLKFAAANLPAVAYAAQDVANHGRVTKYAAESLQARVYLFYTGYYAKPDLVGMTDKTAALSGLEDVISTGGYGLLEKYATLWPAASQDAYAGEDNKETIFAIKYTYTSDYGVGGLPANIDGNYWMVMFGLREQAIFPYGNGWGGATVDPRLWNTFDAADTRKVASVTAIAEEGLAFTNQVKQREYTGYYVKKYSPMVDKNGIPLPQVNGNPDFQIGQYQDYVSIRYADVLLMAAELGSPNAQSYFDQVRKRAYGTSFVSLPVNKDNILKERRLEFAFEGLRFYDQLRQGVAVAAQQIAETATVLNGGVSTSKSISAAKIIETQGLQQIPNTQITLSNGTLKQNAGW